VLFSGVNSEAMAEGLPTSYKLNPNKTNDVCQKHLFNHQWRQKTMQTKFSEKNAPVTVVQQR